jgi:hypothetical protein
MKILLSSTCCSFNDLKFILYLKRGRRAEKKLTKAPFEKKKEENTE